MTTRKKLAYEYVKKSFPIFIDGSDAYQGRQGEACDVHFWSVWYNYYRLDRNNQGIVSCSMAEYRYHTKWIIVLRVKNIIKPHKRSHFTDKRPYLNITTIRLLRDYPTPYWKPTEWETFYRSVFEVPGVRIKNIVLPKKCQDLLVQRQVEALPPSLESMPLMEFKSVVESEREDGYVYGYYAKDINMVKIGKGVVVSARRKYSAQQSPVPVSLLFTIPGYTQTERWIHQFFHKQRRNGEWFVYDRAVRSFLENAQTLWKGCGVPEVTYYKEQGV